MCRGSHGETGVTEKGMHPSQRGLSFLQLGLREIQRLGYLNLPIPRLATLPQKSPSAATAARKQRAQLETRIEFSRVTLFSA